MKGNVDVGGQFPTLFIRSDGSGTVTTTTDLFEWSDLTNGGAGGTESMTYAAWPTFVTGDMRGVRLSPAAKSSYSFAVGGDSTLSMSRNWLATSTGASVCTTWHWLQK